MKKNIRTPPPTPDSLSKAALAYLGRFAASEAALRRVLENRIHRAAMHNSEFRQDHDTQLKLRRVIENIIEKYRKTGVLNDASYTELKINSMRRAGRSARMIAQKLNHAGVSRELVANQLNREEGGGDEAELKAARELARRRKLGPFRKDKTKDAGPDRYRKDLAVLARAGFTLAVARQALGNQRPGVRNDDDDVVGD